MNNVHCTSTQLPDNTRMCSKYLSEKRDRSYKQLQHHFSDCSIVWSIVSISCGVLLLLLLLLLYMYRDAYKPKSKTSWTRNSARGKSAYSRLIAKVKHAHIHFYGVQLYEYTQPFLLAHSNQWRMLCFAVAGFSRDAPSTPWHTSSSALSLRLSSAWFSTSKRKHENGVQDNWQSYTSVAITL